MDSKEEHNIWEYMNLRCGCGDWDLSHFTETVEMRKGGKCEVGMFWPEMKTYII
jgi:hypothetical protein